MKKLSVILLLAIVLATMTACSNTSDKKSKASATTANTTTTASTTQPSTAKHAIKATTKPTEKKEKKPKKPTKPTTMPPTQGKTRPNTHVAVTQAPKGSFSSSDLVFTYKKNQIKLNQKIESVFKLIGDDNSIGVLSKKRTEYEYDDFILTTYKEDDVERIDTIEIIGEGVSASKDAKIGMYASRLKRLYGDPRKLTETEYVYGSGSRTLTFSYENNIVTDITYKYSH
jgi:hypothetical protein